MIDSFHCRVNFSVFQVVLVSLWIFRSMRYNITIELLQFKPTDAHICVRFRLGVSGFYNIIVNRTQLCAFVGLNCSVSVD